MVGDMAAACDWSWAGHVWGVPSGAAFSHYPLRNRNPPPPPTPGRTAAGGHRAASVRPKRSFERYRYPCAGAKKTLVIPRSSLLVFDRRDIRYPLYTAPRSCEFPRCKQKTVRCFSSYIIIRFSHTRVYQFFAGRRASFSGRYGIIYAHYSPPHT